MSAHELNVPQTEAVANFLVGRKRTILGPDATGVAPPNRYRCALDGRIVAMLSDYSCDVYFPVTVAGFVWRLKSRFSIFCAPFHPPGRSAPPLPMHRKLFMNHYYQYRQRAQEFFAKAGFPVAVEHLNLALIEALLNFIAGRKHPGPKPTRKCSPPTPFPRCTTLWRCTKCMRTSAIHQRWAVPWKKKPNHAAALFQPRRAYGKMVPAAAIQQNTGWSDTAFPELPCYV